MTIRDQSYESTTDAARVNGIFTWLSRIDNSDWLPPAILYLTRFRHDTSALIKFFTYLERLAAVMMINRANVNQRIERYGSLLGAIDEGRDLYVQGSPLQVTDSERRDALVQLEGELYNMPFRLYVLLRLDATLSGGEARYDLPIITVEHVLPQNPRAGSQWLQWFSGDGEAERYLHRLGNLVLLNRRKNSAASNLEFARKKAEYFTRGGASPFALTTQVLAHESWRPATVESRQAELIGKLKEIWQL